MGRHVKKGEKGIKIIAPAPYTVQKEVDKLGGDGKPVVDSDGEPVKETKEYQVMAFKAETTFDVSQTEGKELPKIGVDEIKGEVDRYELLMDTKKFRDFHKSGMALQKVSDLICMEHGLSVISPRPYNEREKRTVFPQREAFRDVIRESIDMALSKRPKDFDDFLLELRAAGYEIKRGKHTAIRGRGQKRFIRFRSLGDGYTEAEIKNKIGCISPDKTPNKNIKAKSDEKIDMLLSLQDIIAKGKGPGYELWAKKYNVKNVMKAILFFQEQGLRTYERSFLYSPLSRTALTPS